MDESRNASRRENSLVDDNRFIASLSLPLMGGTRDDLAPESRRYVRDAVLTQLIAWHEPSLPLE